MAEFFAKETIKSLRKLRQLKPDLFKGFMDWDQMVFKDGALSAKIKEQGRCTVCQNQGIDGGDGGACHAMSVVHRGSR